MSEALRPYVPEYRYWVSDLSAYSDEELKRTAELGVGLLALKYVFRPELRARLSEVVALWYTMRHQERALGYLEAVIRYVTSAGQGINAEDVRMALEEVAPKGDALMGTIAQQGLQQGEQRGERRGLRQGLLDGIELALELRFGLDGLRLLPEITRIEDVGLLKAVHEGLRRAETPEALRALYQPLAAASGPGSQVGGG